MIERSTKEALLSIVVMVYAPFVASPSFPHNPRMAVRTLEHIDVRMVLAIL